MRRLIPCFLLALAGCSKPGPSLFGIWFDRDIRFQIEFRGDGTFADSTHNADGSLYAEHHGDWKLDGRRLLLTEFDGPPSSPGSSTAKHRYTIEWLDRDTFGFHDEDALFLRCRRQSTAPYRD